MNTRLRYGLLAAVTAMSALVAVQSTPASAATLIEESFRGATTPAGWEMQSPLGKHTPCLTAAKKPAPEGSLPACNAGPSDQPGQGAFQLTDNEAHNGGDLLLDKAIPATAGLRISFDFFQYKTSTKKGADGISFFLIDGQQENIHPGEVGGSLGYKGLSGGLVGIGFDQYGNFSNPACIKGKKEACGAGGPGLRPNSVAVRGAESTGFKYVAGETAPGNLAVDKAARREDARRTALITLSTAGVLNAKLDFHDGRGAVTVLEDIDLNAIKGQPKLPPTIKLGFAASTGDATNYHEIRDFSVKSLDPHLSVKASGETTVPTKGAGEVSLQVSNAANAGPTNGTVSVTYTMPSVYKTLPGFKIDSASGDGWDCQVGPLEPAEEATPGGYDSVESAGSADSVTCTRPGTGDDVLQPDKTYPPITVKYTAGDSPLRDCPTTAVVTTPGSPDGTTTMPISVTEPASGPDLTTTITHTGTPLAGGQLTYEMTVSNKPSAGPTKDTVIADFEAPEGATIVSVKPGEGWKCTQQAQKVSCTRDDVLKPGASYPPIGVTVALPGGYVTESLTPAGRVNTDGDTNPDNNVAAPDPVTPEVLPAKLSAAINHDGTPVEGGTTSYHLVVANAKDAGPGNAPVTATFNAPPGSTVKSATGDGWTCQIAGTVVTCTRPGTGADALPPGGFYPPVNVDVQFPEGSAGTKVETSGTITAGPDTSKVQGDSVTLAPAPKKIETGIAVTVETNPGRFVPGRPFVYTVTVTNTGPSDAKGVQLDVTLPQIWTKIPWKCSATAGSNCPRPVVVDGVTVPLKGSLSTSIDVAAGGKVTLTVGCVIPPGYGTPLDLDLTFAPPAGAIDSKCTKGVCTGKVTTEKATADSKY